LIYLALACTEWHKLRQLVCGFKCVFIFCLFKIETGSECAEDGGEHLLEEDMTYEAFLLEDCHPPRAQDYLIYR
jgi:hypothetical protein